MPLIGAPAGSADAAGAFWSAARPRPLMPRIGALFQHRRRGSRGRTRADRYPLRLLRGVLARWAAGLIGAGRC
jgi:hypothetical protein